MKSANGTIGYIRVKVTHQEGWGRQSHCVTVAPCDRAGTPTDDWSFSARDADVIPHDAMVEAMRRSAGGAR